MGRAISEPATSRAAGPHDGRILIKNQALKPRRVIVSGPPTTKGARPGKNDGPEWLHRPTAEHVFPDLPPEPAAARRLPWRRPAVVVALAAAVVTVVSVLAIAL